MSGFLPEKIFFDNFYIWFNKDEKQEYYSTPLYLYKATTTVDYENRLVNVYFDEKESEKRSQQEQGLKFPANLYFPYVERIGMFLLRFLNANLESYEKAYESFFFAYGFEILKDLEKEYIMIYKIKFKKCRRK